MEFDLLIDRVVQEVMKKLKSQNLSQNLINKFEKKKCLVIINGGAKNLDQVLLQLKKISINYDLKIMFSKAGKEVVGEDKFTEYEIKDLTMNECSHFLKEIDMVLIPLMTKNTCAKVAVGIMDNSTTYIISKAILLGKEIVALSDSCMVEDNSVYGKQINSNIKKLKSYGIIFLKSIDLSNYILRERKNRINSFRGKKIITLEDMFNIKNSKIILSKDTIITTLAREKAKDSKVVFEIEE